MRLGEKIHQLRKERGMSQEELAGQLTLSRQAISKWELGETIPDTENVIQLSKVFNVSTDYLLNDEYEDDNDIPAVKRNNEHLKMKYLMKVRIASYCVLIIGLLSGVIGLVNGGYIGRYSVSSSEMGVISDALPKNTHLATNYFVLSALLLPVGILMLLYSLSVFKNYFKRHAAKR
jgi:transcriptional regulator with XRE-family HTH domain